MLEKIMAVGISSPGRRGCAVLNKVVSEGRRDHWEDDKGAKTFSW